MAHQVTGGKTPEFHAPEELQKTGPSALKYAKYATGIIVGLGMIAGATALGLHGVNAYAMAGVGGLGGIGALACARQTAQRGRFDSLVSKMKAGKELSRGELRSELIPGGKTPVQMALHRALEDGNNTYFDVAENFILKGGRRAAEDLTVDEWDTLFCRGAQSIRDFLDLSPSLSYSAKSKIRTVIEGKMTNYQETGLSDNYQDYQSLYEEFGGRMGSLGAKLEANAEAAERYQQQLDHEANLYSYL